MTLLGKSVITSTELIYNVPKGSFFLDPAGFLDDFLRLPMLRESHQAVKSKAVSGASSGNNPCSHPFHTLLLKYPE
jgi:hypothetical protein